MWDASRLARIFFFCGKILDSIDVLRWESRVVEFETGSEEYA